MKVLIGGFLFAVFIFGAILGLLWSARGLPAPQSSAVAILNVIEAPTITPPAPIVTATATPEAVPSQVIPPPSGDIRTGDFVRVTGTEGDGLRLHVSAGLSSKVDYIAIESEVFLVKDGPQDVDGYTWWLLQDPYTDKIAGWGVSNYLSVVKNP